MGKLSTRGVKKGPVDTLEGLVRYNVAREEDMGRGLEMKRLTLDLGLDLIIVLDFSYH